MIIEWNGLPAIIVASHRMKALAKRELGLELELELELDGI